MKATGLVPPDHLLPVLMPTRPWQRSQVVAPRVEGRPPDVAKVVNAADVGEKAGGLCPVDFWELALMPRCCHRWRVPERSAQLLELPDACGLTSVHPPEVFRVLEDAASGVVVAQRGLGRADCPYREMNEFIPRLSAPLGTQPHVRDAPGVFAVPAGLGAIVVCPVCPAPGAARRRQQDDVEVAVLHPGQPRVLLASV